nr:hypothetical protein [uncultured Campylobacter sp.]
MQISRLRKGSSQALARSPRLILGMGTKFSLGGLNLRPQRNQKAKYKYKENKKKYIKIYGDGGRTADTNLIQSKLGVRISGS